MPHRRARKIDFFNIMEINTTFFLIRAVRSIQHAEIKELIEEPLNNHRQRQIAARYLCNSGNIYIAPHIFM